ncbi:N-acetylmuramoyl-L-alanine amidase [Alphaproteobacteria bacterium]|jgi:N-acetylmuramoyl-L-alanine amidase|nr:N-acetylmuramoyl-L-alanine amidase [Alphaproteobacteria bacterium]
MRFFLIFIALLLSISVEAIANPSVKSVRIGPGIDKTRLVLEVSEQVKFKAFTLDNPYRLVVDFPASVWSVADRDMPKSGGVVKGLRYGLYTSAVSRVVLDLSKPVKIANAFLLDPVGSAAYRIVVDIQSVAAGAYKDEEVSKGRKQTVQTTPKQSVTFAGVPLPKIKPQKIAVMPRAVVSKGKRVIILDPGHGGVDPGAISKSGTREKQLTLAVAKELKRELERTGKYKVHLTRNRDIFLPLRKRIEIGRSFGGDLFISLHADSHDSSKIGGASVYTLSENASDKEAAALATQQNKADVLAGVRLDEHYDSVGSILIDLAQRETMNLSAMFANLLVNNMRKNWRLRNNTHRFAGFAVLKAPDMASVLLEMGYLTNRKDERTLLSRQQRSKLVLLVVRSIGRYFDQVGAQARG